MNSVHQSAIQWLSQMSYFFDLLTLSPPVATCTVWFTLYWIVYYSSMSFRCAINTQDYDFCLIACIVCWVDWCYEVIRYSDIVSFEMLVFIRYSYQMQDWDCKLLAEANAKKHMLPSFFPITYRYPIPRDWDTASKVRNDVQIATAVSPLVLLCLCHCFSSSLFIGSFIIQAT